MVKNSRINLKVSEIIKTKLEKKAEGYKSLTHFIEEIANNTIIIMNPEVAKIFKLMGGKIQEKLQT